MAAYLCGLGFLKVIFIFTLQAVFCKSQVIQWDSQDVYDIVTLKPNEIAHGDGTKFVIYCQENSTSGFIYVFKSAYLEFQDIPKEYKLFESENETEIMERKRSQGIFNPLSWTSFHNPSVSFPAFSKYCVGVSTSEEYSLQLKVLMINYWKVLRMVIGVILFLRAPSLSRNSFFHYTSGMTAGVLASILILLFIISRIVPKRSASYAIILFGYSFVFYLLQHFYYTLPDLLKNHIHIVLGYVFVSALISFLFCYRFGPVKNGKTIKLIQWSLQGLGILLVFFSSECREFSTASIIIMLLSQQIPASWIAKFKCIWYRYFPPTIKLLTESEFIEQGTRETTRSLDELRAYCNSPECKTWKTILKLKDPYRFAKFVNGDPHLSDQEVLLYESEDGINNLCFSEEDSDEEQETSSNNITTSNHC